MTETIAIISSVSLLVPLLVALVLQSKWSRKVRTAAMLVVTVISGAGAYVADNGLDLSSPSKIVATIVAVIILSSIAYKQLWQPSGATDTLEAKTSKITPREDDIEGELDDDEPVKYAA